MSNAIKGDINKRRIAQNTIFLYIRMLLNMAISLYTSRIVLQQLGVVDFGIYNVIGGVVALFTFINSAMASSTQRYLTYALGKEDTSKINLTFNTSLQIHFIIAIIVCIVAEIGGLWLIHHKMLIPSDKMSAANWVFQFSVLTLVINFINVPYTAILISYERMKTFAYISLAEVSLKLVSAYLLVISPMDKLVVYSILMFCIPLIIRILYTVYCHTNFNTVKIKKIYDKVLFKEMTFFAGWGIIGQIAGIGCTQGLNVLLNIFFGPAVNAARGIAVQVQSAIYQFSYNFQTAVNPQITISYAKGKIKEMHSLIFQSSKLTFFMLFALSLPIIIETPIILRLWLVDVPEHTISFFRIIIWICIIDSMANPLMVAASANGNIKKYQITIGGLLLLTVPISYVVLKLYHNPDSVFYVNLIIAIIAFISRLFIVRPLIQLSLREFAAKVILPCFATGVISAIPPIMLYMMLPKSYTNVFIIIILSVLSVTFFAYFIGMNKNEKAFIKSSLLSRITR